MSVIRADFAALFTPIYDEFMFQEFAEDTQIHPRLFKVIDDKSKDYIVNGLSALGEWEDSDELAAGQFEDPVLAYSKTITPSKKRKKFQVSFEAADQDEYAMLKKEEDARALGRGGRAAVEKTCAAVLYGGFTTACPDGQYLFDSDHPKNSDETTVTYDNLLSGAFSHDALEAAEAEISKNFKDLKGIPIVVPEKAILAYAPALSGSIQRVLSDRASEQPGTTLRNINVYAGKYDPIEWRYLSADMGGSDTAWYIIFPSLGFLKMVWNARPAFTSWVDNDLEAYCFAGRMIYGAAATDWRCGFASTGL